MILSPLTLLSGHSRSQDTASEQLAELISEAFRSQFAAYAALYSRLTEYYSRDLELGFLDGPEDVIQLERELLTHIFDCVSKNYSNLLSLYCVSLWRRTPVSPPFSCSDFHCRGARSPQLREER
jgi:hypothetical protein